MAAQIERLEPADRRLVAEAIDEVLRWPPSAGGEAISWIVASLQAARRVFRLTRPRVAIFCNAVATAIAVLS